MILPITKLPAKVLRSPTVDVEFPLDKKTRRLLMDMLDTVKKADGIGLAAPQVGSNLNLALIYLVAYDIPPFFICNPRIIEARDKLHTLEEGCLSLPGVFGNVDRPKEVTVEFQDLEGKTQRITDDGWIAKVCQHEIDHLNSTLIVDHISTYTKGKDLLPKYGIHYS